MRVLLATPTLFRLPVLEFQMSVMKTSQLLAQHGIMLDTVYIGGDCFIGKARNGLIQTFIESWTSPHPADVLVFIDDDQAWDEQGFLRVVLDSHEIVAVAIPKKNDAAKPEDPQIFNNVMLDMDDNGNCYVENGLLRISQIGSGFMAIKRSAIEKMIKAYPQRYHPGDGGQHELHYSLFESKIVWDEDPTKHGQFWGEDLIFCQKWKAMGEHIWLDPNVNVEHFGRKAWRGNFMEHLQKYAKVETTTLQLVPQLPKPIPSTLEAIEKLAA